MAKLGTAYERVLFDIVQSMEPNAKVTHGTWLDGPDGSREIDVLIETETSGRKIKFVLECKDYSSTRRIGIGVVDAFESKLRDLCATGGAICSNADFADPAREKAKRTKIGLIGILLKGPKVYEILDIAERREIQGSVNNFNLSCKFENPVVHNQDLFSLPLFDSFSLRQIAAFIFEMGVIRFPIVSGRPSFRYLFEPSIRFDHQGRNSLIELTVTGDIQGAWLRKKVRISASEGLYDWLAGTTILGPGNQTITYFDAGFDDPKYWVLRPKFIGGPHATIGIQQFNIGLFGFATQPDNVAELHAKISPSTIELVTPVESLSESMSKSKYAKLYKERLSAQAEATAGRLLAPILP